MTRNEILYLLPYLASLGLSVGVLVYAAQHRRARGVTAYTWYVVGQTLWIFGFILELISPNLPEKIFWDGFQWLASLITVIALPVFAVQYTEHRVKDNERLFQLSLIVPTLFAFLLMTDSAHHLIYRESRLIPNTPFSELSYPFTPTVYILALYIYVVILWAIGLLFRHLFRPHNLYRVQTAIVLFGFLIPVFSTILTLANIQIAPQRDATPFTFTIANMIVAWGLFRFSLFKVVPVGRDRVFEALMDPVVILDNQQMVVDINSAMLTLLNRKASDVIGEPAKTVFDDFPIPILMYTDASHARTETSFTVHGKPMCYEMTVWPLYDSNQHMIGRIYISHDITERKLLEQELRELNLELEKRVNTRTAELAEAYDTTLEGWAKALELRDKETEGHSRRVTETTLAMAKVMGIQDENLIQIRRGALLHDIGKMGIPDHILHKHGDLSSEERQIILKHPQTAYDLLKQIPFLEQALEIPYCHHEKWDGSGYPRGLKESAIPLSARIFAVADVWDALTSDRPYRKAWEKQQAIEYLMQESGKHFDPHVLNIFLQMAEQGKI